MTPGGTASTLTKAQRRHLIEMVSPSGTTRYWLPCNAGEHACALALRAKGLLDGSVVSASDRYFLTDDGLRIARELKANACRAHAVIKKAGRL